MNNDDVLKPMELRRLLTYSDELPFPSYFAEDYDSLVRKGLVVDEKLTEKGRVHLRRVLMLPVLSMEVPLPSVEWDGT